MRRVLALLLAASATTTLPVPATAFGPDGATAPLIAESRGGLSFGVYGIDTANGGVAEERPMQLRIATAAVTWTRHGWSVGLAGGQVHYGIPGVLQDTARLATFSLGREISGMAGGSIAAELRATRLFGDDGTGDILGATLRWTRRF